MSGNGDEHHIYIGYLVSQTLLSGKMMVINVHYDHNHFGF